MKTSPCLIAIVAIMAQSLSAGAQEPAKPAETKVVLRISRELIKKLAGARFTKDQPIDSNSNGVAVSGAAHVEGEIDVKLRESDTETDFDLLLTGNIATQLTAARRPVVVCAHGNAPFTATRRVVFENGKFSARQVCVDVANHFTLDGIGSFRGGPGGALTRGLARPFVRRGLRDGDVQANDEIRTQLAVSIQDPTDRIVGALNTIEPTVAEVREVVQKAALQKKVELVPYHKTTKHFLLISIGPPNRVVAQLPSLARKDRAPLELWIEKRDNVFAEFVLDLSLQRIADDWKKNSKKIGAEILKKHPELIAVFGDEIHMEANIVVKDNWHVITLKPTIKGNVLIDLP